MHSLSRKAGEVIQLEFSGVHADYQLVVPLPRDVYLVARVCSCRGVQQLPYFSTNTQPTATKVRQAAGPFSTSMFAVASSWRSISLGRLTYDKDYNRRVPLKKI